MGKCPIFLIFAVLILSLIHISPVPIDPEQRLAMIAQAAYFRAERRGFTPGYEAEDWLAAESEVDTALTLGAVSSGG